MSTFHICGTKWKELKAASQEKWLVAVNTGKTKNITVLPMVRKAHETGCDGCGAKTKRMAEMA